MRRLFTAVLMLLALTACDRKHGGAKLDPDIARFIATKRLQIQQAPAAQTNGLPNTIWGFFDAADRNDFIRVTNLFATLQQEAGRFATPPTTPGPAGRVWHQVLQFLGLRPRYWPGLNTEVWSPVQEVVGISEVYQEWDPKWLRRFGRDIIDSIPSNSVYFGGTDGGRFIVTALSEAHTLGRPFFTLTQNQLVDGSYLDYVQSIYGLRLHTPTTTDSQQAFQDYLREATRRKETDQLKPGENVQIVSGRTQVSGMTAVMEINGLLAYNIFTNNPDREFFIEESFPLDWMYPHLSPHGLILKLNREPLREMPADIVARDHEYWTRYVKELIGDWLTPETSVSTICAFSKRVYGQRDLGGFSGDSSYAANPPVQKSYAQLRNAIGGVYAWRAEIADSPQEQDRMARETEFAFKQALALCPYLPELASRYVNLLLAQDRVAEARTIAQTAVDTAPEAKSATALLNRVEAREKRQTK